MANAAYKAARGLIRDFGEVEQLQVSRKGPADFVSSADHKAEETLVEELRRARPNFGFLLEEGGEVKGEDSSNRWIIDPLDGTTNYAHQFPMFSVSVGFERDGRMMCGAVYDPIRYEMFTASRGGGAFLNGETISVSGVSSLSDGLLLTGFPYDFREKVERALDLFRSFLVSSQAVRRAGSAALDL